MRSASKSMFACFAALAVYGPAVAGSAFAAAPSPRGAAAPTEAQTFTSIKHATLVELFTSEGCSSCPPADDWIAALGKDPGLWRRFVPVVFHVDYWDSPSWKDPLSQSDFTERQNNYNQVWRNNSMFTPNVVVDGETWEGWRTDSSPPVTSATPLSLTLKLQPSGAFQVTVAATPQTPSCLTAHVALMVRSLTSKVGAGENAGRTMEHTNSSIRLTEVNMSREGTAWSVHGQLEAKAPSHAKGRAVAAWVTACNQMTPLQAVGGLVRSSDEANRPH